MHFAAQVAIWSEHQVLHVGAIGAWVVAVVVVGVVRDAAWMLVAAGVASAVSAELAVAVAPDTVEAVVWMEARKI